MVLPVWLSHGRGRLATRISTGKKDHLIIFAFGFKKSNERAKGAHVLHTCCSPRDGVGVVALRLEVTLEPGQSQPNPGWPHHCFWGGPARPWAPGEAGGGAPSGANKASQSLGVRRHVFQAEGTLGGWVTGTPPSS